MLIIIYIRKNGFTITGEESDNFLSSTAAAGNANGFVFSSGNGARNTSNSSSGTDFGFPIPKDCTLKAVVVSMGNSGSETTNPGTGTLQVFKNNSAESGVTMTLDSTSSGGNAFRNTKNDFNLDYDQGDSFNLRVTDNPSYTFQVGPTRMTAYFEMR